jgi:hypothetical protein
MTTVTVTARFARRWPTALALAAVEGCVVLIFGRSADVELAAGSSTDISPGWPMCCPRCSA